MNFVETFSQFVVYISIDSNNILWYSLVKIKNPKKSNICIDKRMFTCYNKTHRTNVLAVRPRRYIK